MQFRAIELMDCYSECEAETGEWAEGQHGMGSSRLPFAGGGRIPRSEQGKKKELPRVHHKKSKQT